MTQDSLLCLLDKHLEAARAVTFRLGTERTAKEKAIQQSLKTELLLFKYKEPMSWCRLCQRPLGYGQACLIHKSTLLTSREVICQAQVIDEDDDRKQEPGSGGSGDEKCCDWLILVDQPIYPHWGSGACFPQKLWLIDKETGRMSYSATLESEFCTKWESVPLVMLSVEPGMDGKQKRTIKKRISWHRPWPCLKDWKDFVESISVMKQGSKYFRSSGMKPGHDKNEKVAIVLVI